MAALLLSCGDAGAGRAGSAGDGAAIAPVQIAPLTPPARDYWPTDGWRTASPESVGVDSDKLAAVIDYTMTTRGADEERLGIRTDGLLIIRHGVIILERYGRGYSADTPHLAWSVTKSFVNALFGIAVRDHLVDIDTPAHRYIPALDKPDRDTMTSRHLLNMSSGIVWHEGYEASPLKSSVVAMLYTRGHHDMAAFTANEDMRAAPGTYAYYSSGDSNLLMAILREVVPAGRYDDYPWTELFDVIGMDNVTWERDGAGTFIGSSYIYATPRALAKFGFLYLNDGVWAGQRILPEGWLTFTRTPAPAYVTTPPYQGRDKNNMTAHWHANTGIPAAGIAPAWPDAPRDAFAAQGHWGQYIFVIPSLDMVVVRVGDDRDGSFEKNTLLKLVAASVIEPTPSQ